MHAVSPQVMVWDPSPTVGIPMRSEIQHPMVASGGYPFVVPQPYRSSEGISHLVTNTAVPNSQDIQNIVWVQQPNVLPQDENERNHLIVPQLSSGTLHFTNATQSVIPVMMNINGQRVLVNHPVHHVSPAHQPTTYCQVASDQQAHEQIRLVSINNGLQQAPLATLPQNYHPLSIPTLQESQTSYLRPRLTPKRRNGIVVNSCDAVSNWRNVVDDRSLGGMNAAQRRRSQSADEDSKSTPNPSSPSPNKRFAATLTNLEQSSSLWRSPDTRILRKLIDIIEYYFSDECLSKNGYMLKQLSSSDCDGYISIRRVAALKRVKAQTRDLRTVAYAVTQSTKLELDKEGTMIRRKRPLPENIEAPRYIRSVLAINLPTDAPSVDDVSSLFTPYGELTQVRILRPGKAIPTYLKDYTAWVADLGTRVCAVIEFENQDEAQKACREINMQHRGENSLRVALLKPGARIRRTLYRKYKDEPAEGSTETNEYPNHNDSVDAYLPSAQSRERRSSDSSSDGHYPTETNSTEERSSKIQNQSTLHYDASGSGSDSGSDANLVRTKPDKSHLSEICDRVPSDSGYSASCSSDEIDASPAVGQSHVKKFEEASKTPKPFPRQDALKFIDGVPVGAERQPKGPVDDTNGFALHRPAHA